MAGYVVAIAGPAPASPVQVQRALPARPFFVVMTMTPFAASVPYSVAAEGPFTISMSSISSGEKLFKKLNVVPPLLGAPAMLENDAHAVDEDDRGVAQAQRVEAADADVRGGTGGALSKHADARCARGEEVAHRIDGKLFDLLADVADGGDAVPELHATLLAGGGGDDFLQLDDHG